VVDHTDKSLLVFVHIRKTAGMTLRHILHRQYGGRRSVRLLKNFFTDSERSRADVENIVNAVPDDLRVIHGHILYWDDLPWPDGTAFFTLLRNPIERALSHYYWLRARNSKFELPLEDAIAQGAVPDNLQTRVIAGSNPPFGETSAEMLRTAIDHLARFSVVGLTERFDESVALMTRTFGWQPRLYATANATPNRQPRAEIAPETLRLIERHNALDVELYQHAKTKFEEDIAQCGPDFSLEVAALARGNSRLATALEEDGLLPAPPGIRDWAGAKAADVDEVLVELQANLLLREEARLALAEQLKATVPRQKARELEKQVAELRKALRTRGGGAAPAKQPRTEPVAPAAKQPKPEPVADQEPAPAIADPKAKKVRPAAAPRAKTPRPGAKAPRTKSKTRGRETDVARKRLTDVRRVIETTRTRVEELQARISEIDALAVSGSGSGLTGGPPDASDVERMRRRVKEMKQKIADLNNREATLRTRLEESANGIEGAKVAR